MKRFISLLIVLAMIMSILSVNIVAGDSGFARHGFNGVNANIVGINAASDGDAAAIDNKQTESDGATVPKLNEGDIYQILISFKDIYPEGMYWTDETREYTSTTLTPGIDRTGYGCVAFVLELSDAAFDDFWAMQHNDIDMIRVGDIIRTDNDTHSVIVLEVRSSGVVVAEGNYQSSVHWGRFISTKELEDCLTHIWTRYPDFPDYDPPERGIDNDAETDEHDGIVFRAWNDPTGLPTKAGNYYLTVDVELFEFWDTPSGEINLCLNGHTITNVKDRPLYAMYVNIDSTLNIYDCSDSGSGTVKLGGNDYNSILNEGTLNIHGGNFLSAGIYGAAIANYGTMTFNGGTISSDWHGIFANQLATLTVNGGTISGDYQGIVLHGCPMTITGGSIYGGSSGIAVYDEGILTVNSGTIDGNLYGVEVGSIMLETDVTGQIDLRKYVSHGTVVVNDGTINGGQYGLYNSEGTATVNGGTVTGNDCGIYNSEGHSEVEGEIVISGDNMVTVNGGITRGQCSISNFGILIIENGTIEGAGENGTGIGNSGALTVNGGCIFGEKYGLSTGGDNTVIINGGTVSGDDSGIWCTGTIDVCGGTISGVNYGIEIGMGEANIIGGTVSGGKSGIFVHAIGFLKLSGDPSISGGDVDILLEHTYIAVGGELKNTEPYIVAMAAWDFENEIYIIDQAFFTGVITNTDEENLNYNDPAKFAPADFIAEQGYIVNKNDDGQLEIVMDDTDPDGDDDNTSYGFYKIPIPENIDVSDGAIVVVHIKGVSKNEALRLYLSDVNDNARVTDVVFTPVLEDGTFESTTHFVIFRDGSMQGTSAPTHLIIKAEAWNVELDATFEVIEFSNKSYDNDNTSYVYKVAIPEDIDVSDGAKVVIHIKGVSGNNALRLYLSDVDDTSRVTDVAFITVLEDGTFDGTAMLVIDSSGYWGGTSAPTHLIIKAEAWTVELDATFEVIELSNKIDDDDNTSYIYKVAIPENIDVSDGATVVVHIKGVSKNEALRLYLSDVDDTSRVTDVAFITVLEDGTFDGTAMLVIDSSGYWGGTSAPTHLFIKAEAWNIELDATFEVIEFSNKDGDEEPDDGTIKVVPEEGAPEVEVSDETLADIYDEVFTEEEKSNGAKLEIQVSAPVDESDVDSDVAAAIEEAIEGKYTAAGQYFDISLVKFVGDTETKVTDKLNTPVSLAIEIPDDLLNDAPKGYTRHFSVVHVHDGVAEILDDIDGDATDGSITISINSFSPFVIVYNDIADTAGDLKGDINGDGKVDVQDGVLMQRILAKLETNPEYLSRADLNGDEEVDVQDGVKMQRILAHLD